MTGLHTVDRENKAKRLCLGLQTNRLPTPDSVCHQFDQPRLFTGTALSRHYSGDVSGQMIALIRHSRGAHRGATRLTGAAEASKVGESTVGFAVNLGITADVLMRQPEHVTVISVPESAGKA